MLYCLKTNYFSNGDTKITHMTTNLLLYTGLLNRPINQQTATTI